MQDNAKLKYIPDEIMFDKRDLMEIVSTLLWFQLEQMFDSENK